jgi:cytochrome c
MKHFSLLLSLCALAGAAHANPGLSAKEAADALMLAKNNGCLSCHALDEKIVGPAYSKIATKYSADKDAAASLAQSIRNGSQGKWGRIPMPANGSVSQDDAMTLARWILGTPK